MTLEENLRDARIAYRNKMTPDLKVMICAMFAMLGIKDAVGTNFNELHRQVVGVTSILEYYFHSSTTVHAVDGSELSTEMVAEIIKDLKAITEVV